MTEFRHFSMATDERLFVCSETGETGIKDEFVHRLDDLRDACGFPFIIDSGYRSPLHSKERVKKHPGMHTEGKAADIRVFDGVQRRRIVEEASKLDFRGIGVAKGFVHVDIREGQPVLWTY